MFNLFKPKPTEKNDILERLHTRLIDVEQRLLALEAEQFTFRNKILRKIQTNTQPLSEETTPVSFRLGQSVRSKQ